MLRFQQGPLYPVLDRITDRGKEARNNTTQTQSKTISLNMNSPVRFQAIGSVDKLHLTTPGVVKKNDHVMEKVTRPNSEPTADKIGLNAPAAMCMWDGVFSRSRKLGVSDSSRWRQDQHYRRMHEALSRLP